MPWPSLNPEGSPRRLRALWRCLLCGGTHFAEVSGSIAGVLKAVVVVMMMVAAQRGLAWCVAWNGGERSEERWSVEQDEKPKTYTKPNQCRMGLHCSCVCMEEGLMHHEEVTGSC